MSTQAPPIQQKIIDENGLPTLPWTLFFNNTFKGDAGTNWTPTIVNLTGTTTSITGRFYRLSQYITYFKIVITPNGNTTSTAGATYIDNFPLRFSGDSFNTVVSGAGGGSIGINRQSDNRIYIPVWTDISVPLTIIGIGEAT